VQEAKRQKGKAMKLADFVSKLKMFLADAAETAAALFIGEVIGWVIVGAIWVIGWAGVYLFFLARSFSSYTGVAAISCGMLILVLVAWRALKADIKALDDPNDDPRANRLIGKRREGRSYDYRD
jgi:hypothetical protein